MWCNCIGITTLLPIVSLYFTLEALSGTKLTGWLKVRGYVPHVKG